MGSISLEDACRKIFRISRMVAMFPLSDDCRFSLRLLIAPASVLFLLIVHTTCWVVNIKALLKQHKAVYHLYLHVFRKIFTTFSCILYVSQLVSKREKLRMILNNLKLVDSELGLLREGPTMTLNPFKYLFNIFLGIFGVFVQCLSNAPGYWMQEHIDTVLLAVFINQMLAFFDLLRYSLEQISVFPSIEGDRHYTRRTRIYNLIEDCSENLNDSYGTGMFLTITTFFVTILHQLYQCVINNMTTSEISNIVLTVAGYLWFVVQLILAGSGLTSKATMFNIALYDQLLNEGPKSIHNLEEIFFHFERVKELQWTANGFFSFDKHLICTMITTGTTYLVILVEYSY